MFIFNVCGALRSGYKMEMSKKILPGNDSPHSSASDLVGVDVVAHFPPHPPAAQTLHRTADGLRME